MTWVLWGAPSHWRGRVRSAWLMDSMGVRWGLPAGVAALGFGMGLAGLAWFAVTLAVIWMALGLLLGSSPKHHFLNRRRSEK